MFDGKLDKGSYYQPDPSADFPQRRPEVAASCQSHFLAANAQAMRDKRNDINGIFATFCRHGCFDTIHGKEKCTYLDSFVVTYKVTIMPGNVDMPEGEKYTYVRAALRKFRLEYPNMKMVLFYDIACRIKPYLNVSILAAFYVLR